MSCNLSDKYIPFYVAGMKGIGYEAEKNLASKRLP
jgi:hypothetical protein